MTSRGDQVNKSDNRRWCLEDHFRPLAGLVEPRGSNSYRRFYSPGLKCRWPYSMSLLNVYNRLAFTVMHSAWENKLCVQLYCARHKQRMRGFV